jgi:hypothetical protein
VASLSVVSLSVVSLTGGRRAGLRLGEPLVQPVAHLVRCVGPPLPFGTGDRDPGRRHADDAGQPEHLPPAHLPRLRPVPRETAALRLDQAVELTRTGDIWLFRGRKAADRAIQLTTNSPVNHVGMSVVLDDLPPLMWHAELGRSLPDLWSGTHQRGVQLHELRAAVHVWADRYGQQGWLRQLDRPVTATMDDALLRTIARLDGTPFPSTARLAAGWVRGRLPARRQGWRVLRRGRTEDSLPETTLQEAPEEAGLESAFCAEVVALTYEAMGLLPPGRRPGWYDPGRFWSGDELGLAGGYALGGELAVAVP